MRTIIGTCSECGGPVAVPTIWAGIYPPVPECLHCHAKAQRAHGPIIPMEPRRPTLPDPEPRRANWEKMRPMLLEEAERQQRAWDHLRKLQPPIDRDIMLLRH